MILERAIGYPRLDFHEVTSTLDIAREQARRGAPHGTLITAVHQTAGRGRRGAQWHDRASVSGEGDRAAAQTQSPGQESAAANALLTFVLRPDDNELPLSGAWRVPFMASLACVRALRELGYSGARVKWPNDLVIAGKKTGGILVESMPEVDGGGRIYLLGVGINVGQTEFPDASEYALPPTSLALSRASGEGAVNAVDVTNAVAAELDAVWNQHLSSGAALIEAWRAYQITGQMQAGLDLATGESVSGSYLDVRASDGAGLLADGLSGARRAVMPLV